MTRAMLIHKMAQQPYWYDIWHKKNSTNTAIPIFDALRGYAALLVLASHTDVLSWDKGVQGIVIFFCLSGFLLTSPFINDTSLNFQKIMAYFNRRLWRVIPMYLVYLIAAFFFFKNDIEWLIEHLFFIQSEGHLWTIKHELYFYALLPLIILGLRPLRKYHLLSGIILILVAYLYGVYPTQKILSSTDFLGTKIPLFIAPFICGMAAAYFYAFYRLKSAHAYRAHGNIIGIIIPIALLVYFTAINQKHFWHNNPFEIGLIGSIVLLSFLMTSDATFLKILVPLRAIGVVGYSFYLFHWIIKDLFIVLEDIPYLYFISSATVTYFLSCFFYATIESPCMEIGKIISKKIMGKTTRKKAA